MNKLLSTWQTCLPWCRAKPERNEKEAIFRRLCKQCRQPGAVPGLKVSEAHAPQHWINPGNIPLRIYDLSESDLSRTALRV